MTKEQRLENIINILSQLSEHRLHWVEKVIDMLNCPHTFELKNNTLMNEDWFLAFGDALMIHHAFSKEPFTKDKFEHALVNTAKLIGIDAEFAPRGNRGHDVEIDKVKFSLKTQADRNIKRNLIWISKYMELGKGDWTDKDSDLEGLVELFLEHLSHSQRILILRCLGKEPWHYELIEIPKSLLEKAKTGKLKMMHDSRQLPKPGYCTVGSGNVADFMLYFDGGSERKLQVKNLQKDLCSLIAVWQFDPPRLDA